MKTFARHLKRWQSFDMLIEVEQGTEYSVCTIQKASTGVMLKIMENNETGEISLAFFKRGRETIYSIERTGFGKSYAYLPFYNESMREIKQEGYIHPAFLKFYNSCTHMLASLNENVRTFRMETKREEITASFSTDNHDFQVNIQLELSGSSSVATYQLIHNGQEVDYKKNGMSLHTVHKYLSDKDCIQQQKEIEKESKFRDLELAKGVREKTHSVVSSQKSVVIRTESVVVVIIAHTNEATKALKTVVDFMRKTKIRGKLAKLSAIMALEKENEITVRVRQRLNILEE